MADTGVRLPSAALDPPGRRSPPPRVDGTSPRRVLNADVAQLAEHHLPKVNVARSTRVIRSGPGQVKAVCLRRPIAVGYPPEGCAMTRVTLSRPVSGGFRGGTAQCARGEMADAPGSGPGVPEGAWRFESSRAHQEHKEMREWHGKQKAALINTTRTSCTGPTTGVTTNGAPE